MTLCCHQLGLRGSSDHHTVLTQVDVGVAQHNKDLHQTACRRMVVTSKWAIQKWEVDLCPQTTSFGSSWSRRNRKSAVKIPSIPSPSRTKQWPPAAREKAQLLANLFTEKMKVETLWQSPPHLEQQCEETVTKVVTQTQVK